MILFLRFTNEAFSYSIVVVVFVVDADVVFNVNIVRMRMGWDGMKMSIVCLAVVVMTSSIISY